MRFKTGQEAVHVLFASSLTTCARVRVLLIAETDWRGALLHNLVLRPEVWYDVLLRSVTAPRNQLCRSVLDSERDLRKHR